MKKTNELNQYKKALGLTLKALDFYADPGTYFAIGFLPDPPCGDFIKDFSKTEDLGHKPGKKARKAIDTIIKKYGNLKVL